MTSDPKDIAERVLFTEKHLNWSTHEQILAGYLLDALAEVEKLRRLHEPITDTYACQRCGRRDGQDAVIPNQVWNEIEAATGFNILCLWCLDAVCAERGHHGRVLLAFCGRALSGGTDPGNSDQHWERHLGDLTGRCSTAEADNERLREALRVLVAADDWSCANLDSPKSAQSHYREAARIARAVLPKALNEGGPGIRAHGALMAPPADGEAGKPSALAQEDTR